MKKLVIGGLLGLGVMVGAAAPAAAADLHYSGYWFQDNRACVLTGLSWSNGTPYECRWNAGGSVWELWMS